MSMTEIDAELSARAQFDAALESLSSAVVGGCLWRWGDGCGGYVIERITRALHSAGIDLELVTLPPRAPRIPLTPRQRAEVFARDGIRCRWCGSTDRPTVDHVHPVRFGGTNDLENLQVLCAPCNAWKSTRIGSD